MTIKVEPTETNFLLIATAALEEYRMNRIHESFIKLHNRAGLFYEEDRIYTGFVFGKYDFLAEFKHQSAKVASYESVSRIVRLQNTLGEPWLHATLIQGNEVKWERESQEGSSHPIRAYVFVSPRLSINLIEILTRLSQFSPALEEEFDVEFNLYVSSSGYPVIVTIRASNFKSQTDALTYVKGAISALVEDTATYYVLQWGSLDEELNDRRVGALIHAALHPPGDGQPRITLPGNWRIVRSTPGFFDCIIENIDGFRSLAEVRNAIFRLRRENKGLIQKTSTLLFLKDLEREERVIE